MLNIKVFIENSFQNLIDSKKNFPNISKELPGKQRNDIIYKML
jgi:hypothetical protein